MYINSFTTYSTMAPTFVIALNVIQDRNVDRNADADTNLITSRCKMICFGGESNPQPIQHVSTSHEYTRCGVTFNFALST